jgi:hypothetical protein
MKEKAVKKSGYENESDKKNIVSDRRTYSWRFFRPV